MIKNNTIPDICKLVGRDKKHLVQYCLPLKKSKSIQFPVLASEKLDGCFGLVYVVNGKVYIYSRTGEPYISMEHLYGDFLEINHKTQLDIFTCELYSPDLIQSVISGYCRDKKKQHKEIQAYIHDAMTFEEFKSLDTPTNAERAKYLADMFVKELPLKTPYVHLIPQKCISSYSALLSYAKSIWATGGEGVVAKAPFRSYEAGKRNPSMIKIKQNLSYDLLVVSLHEGNGKFKGMLGEIICKDKKGNVVAVGTGFTIQERKWFWSEWGYRDILNKIVQVDAMTLTKNNILREPVFKGVRTDKLEPDMLGD